MRRKTAHLCKKITRNEKALFVKFMREGNKAFCQSNILGSIENRLDLIIDT